MTRATSAQLMLQYPQPGSADQCVCTDGSCISNVIVCDGVWQYEGNDKGSFCEPIYRFLSQNPNARMENLPLLMDLAFWKRKCVTYTETAEVRKTKDLSAPLQEHRQKHPDVEKKWINVWQRKMHQLQICMWRCLELQKGWRRSKVLQAQESSLSSRLWHWRIDVHWWVLCEAVPVVWRPIRLHRWSRRMQISYGLWLMQRLHVSGRFSLSEMELSGLPTHELLRRKWRIQLPTASAQYRDDLSHPRIHAFTLSPIHHDFWLLWWSSRVRRLSDKLVCNRELNTPDCLRWSTLQPSQSRNFSQYQGHSKIGSQKR